MGRQTGGPSRCIGIAARNREHALCQQLAQRVIHLAGLPLVAQASGQSLDQSVAAVRSLQQDGSAIGTAIPLIELQHGRLAKLSENNRHCVVLSSTTREAFLVASNCLDNLFVAQLASRAFTFVHNAG